MISNMFWLRKGNLKEKLKKTGKPSEHVKRDRGKGKKVVGWEEIAGT